MTRMKRFYLSLAGAALFSLSAAFTAIATGPAAQAAECDSGCVRTCQTGCAPDDTLCREFTCYRNCGCIVP
ncbi:hypothetical protein [Luteimonas huabeiensis]|uniref:hypothetical protein n=1 Tax=Luteimonas huabeiensis TaxID=1244513 RepID=UPI001267C75C|nr:hypothetical protein [Luteimonas huabeiensis]